MLDRYCHGATSRISPEAPVPVVHVQEVEERPGGAANVALNVAALGASPILFGMVGDDAAGTVLRQLLDARGVACRLIRIPGKPTATKMRVVSRHQQLIRLDFEDGFEGAGAAEMFADYEDALAGADAVVLSDYGKGALKPTRQFVDAARAASVPVLVDPKGTDFSDYRGATVITPNLAEFEAVVGLCRDLEELSDKGDRLRRALMVEALLITRGDQGMTLVTDEGTPLHVPARARDVYDVTGAGDTVIGVLAAALAAGQDLTQAVNLSNLAAGVVVGKMGTASASRAELEAALSERNYRGRGVLGKAELAAAVKGARALGKRIVMTNGCFDILHVGHVSYLAKAKALGDRLVVAVNDDASVQRLKGHGRPVNTLDRRMAVLEALGAVDWVVAFSEDTPERLIRAVAPDVLVKGGDYRAEDVVGGDWVRRQGGRVAIVDLEEGVSTTATIQAAARSPAQERRQRS